MSKKIIILGGSYAGVKAGKTLHKAFKKNDDVEITIIDKHRFHTLMTELHEVAAHRTEKDSIKIDLFKIFAGRKVKVIVDEIKGIDFEKQFLTSNTKKYEYDYLILATGNESNFFGTEGAKENAFTLWSYEDAVKIRNHIENMFEKASLELDIEERKKLLTFAVCGGGFTGVEMVGEIGDAKKQFCEKYNINPKEVTIYNIEAVDRILCMLDSKAQIKRVENKYYKKLGITLLKNAPIVKVDKDSFTIKDGTIIPTYTLIWTAGIKNNTFAANLGLQTGSGGRILVNEFMQTLDFKNVFAAGDNTAFEDEDGPLPQIVEAAEQTGHTAASNIAALINGTEFHKHKQKYHGFMVSIGSRYAVADTGFKSSGWFAMLIKHFVNFYYQFMVSGLRQLWNYWRHEFFHVKNKRSFLGGHFSKASPNFWLVPLRVWLGYMWLVEGVKKIEEGWLTEMKMGYLLSKTNDTNAIPQAVTDTTTAASQITEAAVEATTAATKVVETVTQAGIDAATTATEIANSTSGAIDGAASNIPGFIQWSISHSPKGWGEPLFAEPPGIMQWVLETFYAPNAVLFQTLMVIAEIAIGICLIIGLFTFLASSASILMTIAISLTSMADATILWYTFGGIAIIAGAGSTFGLDYYILPKLKIWWSKTKFARKSYLYFD